MCIDISFDSLLQMLNERVIILVQTSYWEDAYENFIVKEKYYNDKQERLKEQGIHFYFALLDKYRNFIKYDFYKSEDEYRYLVVQEKGEEWTVNAEYNLVAPYIDRRLSIGAYSRKSARKDDFPFILRRVILGPAMTNQKYNVWQLNYMASRRNLWGFKVEPSRIDNFR